MTKHLIQSMLDGKSLVNDKGDEAFYNPNSIDPFIIKKSDGVINYFMTDDWSIDWKIKL